MAAKDEILDHSTTESADFQKRNLKHWEQLSSYSATTVSIAELDTVKDLSHHSAEAGLKEPTAFKKVSLKLVERDSVAAEVAQETERGFDFDDLNLPGVERGLKFLAETLSKTMATSAERVKVVEEGATGRRESKKSTELKLKMND